MASSGQDTRREEFFVVGLGYAHLLKYLARVRLKHCRWACMNDRRVGQLQRSPDHTEFGFEGILKCFHPLLAILREIKDLLI